MFSFAARASKLYVVNRQLRMYCMCTNESQRRNFSQKVFPIKNLRPRYEAKLLILPTGACFQLEIRIYLATGGTFKYFSQTFISELRETA